MVRTRQKVLLPLVAGALAVSMGGSDVKPVVARHTRPTPRAASDDPDRPEERASRMGRRFREQRTDRNGAPLVGARLAAWEAWEKREKQRPPPPPPPSGASPLSAMHWSLIGPDSVIYFGAEANHSPASGRLRAIVIDPTSPSTMFAGAAYGGVWKTTDGGASWKPLTDAMPSLPIGAMAMDPHDPQTIYAATGEGGDGEYEFEGEGILKTTDGGATWTLVGKDVFEGLSIPNVAIDPNTGAIYAAGTYGSRGKGDFCTNTYVDSTHEGLWKSTDGGLTWTQLLKGSISTFTLDASTSPPTIFYSKIYGAGYVFVEGSSPQTIAGLPHGTSNPPLRWITFSVAPSSPSVVYAGVGVDGSTPTGTLYVSTDHGATWTHLANAPNYCHDQCDYDNVVTIDPTDPGTVYLGGSLCSVWKGTDLLGASPTFVAASMPNQKCASGGANWPSDRVHPDVHAIELLPDGQTLYVGGDGGMARSKDGGKSWTRLNEGLATLQFYGICLDPTDPEVVYGGTQDNGNLKRDPGKTSWSSIGGGDGITCAVDHTSPKTVLTTDLDGIVYQSKDGGESAYIVFYAGQGCQGDPGCGDRFDYSLVVGDPSTAGTFYVATYRLWKTSDAGDTWTPVSDDLTAGTGHLDCTNGAEYDDAIGTVAISPHASTTIFTGSAAGFVGRTTDGGKSWTKGRPAPLPDRYVTGIGFDPIDEKVVWAAFSGYDATTPDTPGHLFRSADGGETWQLRDIDVDTPIDALVVHPVAPNVLYVGTDFGVLVSTDGGESWGPLGADLPRSAVMTMEFDDARSRLVVGTYGRSAWEMRFPATIGAWNDSFVATIPVGGPPVAHTLHVTNDGVKGSILHAAATSDSPWLKLGATSAKVAGDLAWGLPVTVSADGLAIGDYQAIVTVADPDATSPKVDIAVTLHVVSADAGTAGASGGGAGGGAGHVALHAGAGGALGGQGGAAGTAGKKTADAPLGLDDEDDDGCGCRIGRRTGGAPALFAVVALAIAARRRRRRFP